MSGKPVTKVAPAHLRAFATLNALDPQTAPLTPQQMRIIGHCCDSDHAMTVSEIAAEVAIAPARASRVIDGLVSLGLLLRVEDPEDRRQKRIQPSAEGRKIDNTVRGHLASVVKTKP